MAAVGAGLVIGKAANTTMIDRPRLGLLDRLMATDGVECVGAWRIRWTGWKSSCMSADIAGQWIGWREDPEILLYSSTPGLSARFRRGEIFDISIQPWQQRLTLPDVNDRPEILDHAKKRALEDLLGHMAAEDERLACRFPGQDLR